MADSRGKQSNNVSEITTKSGTKVYVLGNYGDQKQRDAAGDYFVNVYNRNFTEKEQKSIGNILYDMHNKHDDSSTKTQSKHWVASTGTFVGKDAKKLNPRHKKMVDTQFTPDVRKDEATITHELIHAYKFMHGVKGDKHNEKKIDFEMVGRVSKHGIHSNHTGYYFSPMGNPYLAKAKLPNTEKGRIATEGMYSDRRLLTGSLSKSITGEIAVRRANNLFRKSFFFKRKF